MNFRYSLGQLRKSLVEALLFGRSMWQLDTFYEVVARGIDYRWHRLPVPVPVRPPPVVTEIVS